MSATRICLLATATLGGVLTPVAESWAQAYGAHSVVEHNDLRWFEPTQIDLDGSADRRKKGWSASVEKLGWSISGERITLGDPNVVNSSEEIYQKNPDITVQNAVTGLALALNYDPGDPRAPVILDQIVEVLGVEFTGNFIDINVGDDDMPVVFQSPEIVPGTGNAPPAPYNVQNGIQDAAPDAAFAFGERYEIGYSDGERGFRVGILDGPKLTQHRAYGAGPGNEYTAQSLTGFADLHPFYGGGPPQDLDQDGILDNPGDTNDLYALGFGSVAINFAAQEDFFVGFRDYFLNTFPGSGVVTGPINNVTNYGSTEDDLLDTDLETDLGVGDDINQNGIAIFTLFFADLNGDGEVDDDELVGSFVDYGDLYEFDVFFEEVSVRSVTEINGVELMLTHQLDTRHKLEQGRRDSVELSYGVRYMDFRDYYRVNGFGSVIHGTDVSTEMENQLIGPQIGLNWTHDHGAWDFVVDGRFMFAYNRTDRNLNGIFATGAVPGSLNTPINVRPTTTVLGDTLDEFSPLAELRIEARYKLTSAISLNVGYTGTYIDNIERAAPALRWTAPNYSLQSGRSNVFVNGVNGGIEFRY